MSRLIRGLRRARDWFPVTSLGALVCGIAVAAYVGFGAPRSDYVIQLVAVLAIALVIVAVAVVLVGTFAVHRSVVRYVEGEGGGRARAATDGPIVFEARRGYGIGLRMPRRAWLPLFEVTWTWEAPADFDVEIREVDGEWVEHIETHRRAIEESIERRFVVEDTFGLARIAMHETETRSLRVEPFIGNLDRAPILRSLASGEDLAHPSGMPRGDHVDMRRYVAGDPLRLALWKVFARTRQLMVRTPEKAIAPAVRIVAYLVSSSGDEPAAAAAHVAIDGGLLGDDWLFGADGSASAAGSQDEARLMILRSRNARGTEAGDAAGLSRFVKETSEAEPVRLVLFLPAVSGPWLDRVTAVLRAHPGRATAVVVTDGVRAPTAVTALERIVRLDRPKAKDGESFTTPDAIVEVGRVLAAAGAEVTAFDRLLGRALALGSPSARRVA
jgi:hypothetical protein